MNKKIIIYYILLVILFLISIYQVMGFEFATESFRVYILKIWAIPILIFLAWSKKDFTGKVWCKIKKKEKTLQKPYLPEEKNSFNTEDYISLLPELNKKEKQAYIDLTILCCPSKIQNKIIPFLEQLKDFSRDKEEYMSTLNYVIEYLDINNVFFIMSLDYKQDVETLAWVITTSLQNNFQHYVELPSINNYQNMSVSFDNVFEEFDEPLRSIEYQMGFIDTESDEYVIIIHKVHQKKEIEKLINIIGYNYFDTQTDRRLLKPRYPFIIKKAKFDTIKVLFFLVMLILCPLFTFLTYKIFLDEGLSFIVVIQAVTNFFFYYISINVILEQLKLYKSNK